MTFSLRWLRTRVSSLVRRARYERELDRELRFHLDMLTEQNVRSGMEPDAARRAALRTFGEVDRVKDDVDPSKAYEDITPADLERGGQLGVGGEPPRTTVGPIDGGLHWAWMKVAAWRWIASTTCGWQWPVLVTAMPLLKSRYSVPSAVVTVEPLPETTSRSVT